MCLRSKLTGEVSSGGVVLRARRTARVSAGGGEPSGGAHTTGPALLALEALTLPAVQTPQVTADLVGVHLAPGLVHVGVGDQALLVAGEGHPLGQHVVGVGEPGAPVGSALVGELDAVLAQQD